MTQIACPSPIPELDALIFGPVPVCVTNLGVSTQAYSRSTYRVDNTDATVTWISTEFSTDGGQTWSTTVPAGTLAPGACPSGSAAMAAAPWGSSKVTGTAPTNIPANITSLTLIVLAGTVTLAGSEHGATSVLPPGTYSWSARDGQTLALGGTVTGGSAKSQFALLWVKP